MSSAWAGPCDRRQNSISSLQTGNKQLPNRISMILFKLYKNIKCLEINPRRCARFFLNKEALLR